MTELCALNAQFIQMEWIFCGTSQMGIWHKSIFRALKLNNWMNMMPCIGKYWSDGNDYSLKMHHAFIEVSWNAFYSFFTGIRWISQIKTLSIDNQSHFANDDACMHVKPKIKANDSLRIPAKFVAKAFNNNDIIAKKLSGISGWSRILFGLSLNHDTFSCFNAK